MGKFDLKSLLSEKSLIKGYEESNEAKKSVITHLSVHKLIPSEDNFYSVEGIKELKDSIELFGGVKQNLIVRHLGDGQYKVIAGHKRRLASLALVEEGKVEFEHVPCVIEEADSVEERLLLIMTNSTARQLTDYEKARQAEELKDLLTRYKKREKLSGRVRDLVADILGTSSAHVGRMEAITNNLSDEFKEEWKENGINTSTAYELSKLTEEQQEEALEKYKEQGSINASEAKEIKQEQAEEIEEPMQNQIGFYEEEEEQQSCEEEKDVKQEVAKSEDISTKQEVAGCGFCKEDYHTSILTEEGNYLIDIDSANKVVRLMRRECDAEVVAFVFCPMCGRKL